MSVTKNNKRKREEQCSAAHYSEASIQDDEAKIKDYLSDHPTELKLM